MSDFSALQRAENSSICTNRALRICSANFSALQRAENSSIDRDQPLLPRDRRNFSALQRAENSSMHRNAAQPVTALLFQCSSASRKFLNRVRRRGCAQQRGGFQCSSASRKFLNSEHCGHPVGEGDISVLFSEPKIPQFAVAGGFCGRTDGFQCSSASRKFLNIEIDIRSFLLV